MKRLNVLLLLLICCSAVRAENGYDLWLRYVPIKSTPLLVQYKKQIATPVVLGSSATAAAARKELATAFTGLTGNKYVVNSSIGSSSSFITGTLKSSAVLSALITKEELNRIGDEGFIIKAKPGKTFITGNTDIAVLYGIFHYLRLLQTNQQVSNLNIVSVPKLKLRMLNHWDNLDRTVERGYAGFSIWDWHRLPGYIDPRYIDYARANASIGINAVSLTNVNANARILTTDFMKKAKVLADIFRPYGIKVFLTARFSAPIEIGGLKTADPLDLEVIAFWKKKTDEMYQHIPDFGGYLVKANSEGQPGPHEYKRTHAEGANMLADVLAPHGGVLIWRAFVYSHEIDEDRHKQANLEFVPLDGKFRENVIIQVKNGAIDFQPREPFHPLFGAVKQTNLGVEFQITQEYLGQATQLVFLSPMWEEVLRSKTFRPTPTSTVAGIVDGSDSGQKLTLMAGVSNIGTDRNWTGHLFGQANWYAFGRLAWDPYLSSAQIAEEWTKLTFGQNSENLVKIKEIMLDSHEAAVNYMTPLGLHHIMGWDHHYGPGPWVTGGRADWTALYYHRADSLGIGFDRTATGSKALDQYAPELIQAWSDSEQIPEKYLLWFHHLPWDYTMKSGKTLWEEIGIHYDHGVKSARKMKSTWESLNGAIDPEQYSHVSQLLEIQVQEAEWWRNACLLYFQSISQRPFPSEIEQPEGDLEYYKSLRFPTAPGIRPRW